MNNQQLLERLENELLCLKQKQLDDLDNYLFYGRDDDDEEISAFGKQRKDSLYSILQFTNGSIAHLSMCIRLLKEVKGVTK
mgnify:CR=1 FL=1